MKEAFCVGLIRHFLREDGTVGWGDIGREMFVLARPLGMRHLAHDSYATPEMAAEVGAELTELEELLGDSDFVAINCALMPETHHLRASSSTRRL